MRTPFQNGTGPQRSPQTPELPKQRWILEEFRSEGEAPMPAIEVYIQRHNPAFVAEMAARTAAQEAAFFLPYLRPGMQVLDVGSHGPARAGASAGGAAARAPPGRRRWPERPGLGHRAHRADDTPSRAAAHHATASPTAQRGRPVRGSPPPWPPAGGRVRQGRGDGVRVECRVAGGDPAPSPSGSRPSSLGLPGRGSRRRGSIRRRWTRWVRPSTRGRNARTPSRRLRTARLSAG